MNIEQTAREFFEACETGRGWEACGSYCHDNAGFACQADALADTKTLEGYAEWMKGLLGPIPDGHYELTAFAADADRGTVVASAVFHGTQTGAGGPGDPTGKSVASDYAYVMQFDGDRIAHMTKIWNDAQALRQLGWA
ncbi:ester cyclase [Marimonas lutisalis]|uniref:ester cyclase n=1 Tax=Marimonas lutisalis TaxID=2545756 RepID=UPI0010F536F5|nr:ester cyclase [Marimonas lutisalis]